MTKRFMIIVWDRRSREYNAEWLIGRVGLGHTKNSHDPKTFNEGYHSAMDDHEGANFMSYARQPTLNTPMKHCIRSACPLTLKGPFLLSLHASSPSPKRFQARTSNYETPRQTGPTSGYHFRRVLFHAHPALHFSRRRA